MVRVPSQAVPFLKGRLRPPPPVEAARLDRLIRDLDSASFAVRDKATRELEEAGDPAVPALRQALADRPSPEARRRLEQVFLRLQGWSGDRLRELRAVEVLEHVGSPEARQVLQEVARWTPPTRLSQEAAAALRRLAARK